MKQYSWEVFFTVTLISDPPVSIITKLNNRYPIIFLYCYVQKIKMSQFKQFASTRRWVISSEKTIIKKVSWPKNSSNTHSNTREITSRKNMPDSSNNVDFFLSFHGWIGFSQSVCVIYIFLLLYIVWRKITVTTSLKSNSRLMLNRIS